MNETKNETTETEQPENKDDLLGGARAFESNFATALIAANDILVLLSRSGLSAENQAIASQVATKLLVESPYGIVTGVSFGVASEVANQSRCTADMEQ